MILDPDSAEKVDPDELAAAFVEELIAGLPLAIIEGQERYGPQPVQTKVKGTGFSPYINSRRVSTP